MIVQGHDTPSAPSRPAKHQKPAQQKQGRDKPAAHKPTHQKPSRHRPTQQKQGKHGKPERQNKTAGRNEVEVIWFDIEFAPLATSGHIH